MKTVLFLFLLLVMNIPPVWADELYVWTDENGVTQSSTTKPEGWKDQKWKHTNVRVAHDKQEPRKGSRAEGKNEAESLRPGASFESRHPGAGVGPGVSSGVIIEN
jgi:hypothetical protein